MKNIMLTCYLILISWFVYIPNMNVIGGYNKIEIKEPAKMSLAISDGCLILTGTNNKLIYVCGTFYIREE